MLTLSANKAIARESERARGRAEKMYDLTGSLRDIVAATTVVGGNRIGAGRRLPCISAALAL